MTITAQRLLTELGNRAWSGFNADDMDWETEDSRQAKTELNFAVRYLINLQDFPFRAKEKTLNASRGMSTYSMPVGQVTNVYNADTLESLTFSGSGENKDLDQTGEPQEYWIDYRNPAQKLHLYPTPDKDYTYKIVCNEYRPVKTAAGDLGFEFTRPDDYINMPSNIEYLFMDCLILRTMITNNKDEQDENYRPMIDEFNEAWKVFKRACKPARKESYCIW